MRAAVGTIVPVVPFLAEFAPPLKFLNLAHDRRLVESAYGGELLEAMIGMAVRRSWLGNGEQHDLRRGW